MWNKVWEKVAAGSGAGAGNNRPEPCWRVKRRGQAGEHTATQVGNGEDSGDWFLAHVTKPLGENARILPFSPEIKPDHVSSQWTEKKPQPVSGEAGPGREAVGFPRGQKMRSGGLLVGRRPGPALTPRTRPSRK